MNDQRVHAVIHAIHKEVSFKEPPFDLNQALMNIADIEVVARDLEFGDGKGRACSTGSIEVYHDKPRHGPRALLIYEKGSPDDAQRWLIAHELGHWLFDFGGGSHGLFSPHYKWLRVAGAPGERRARLSGEKSLDERTADFFAYELLVPLWMLHDRVLFDPSIIAASAGVLPEVAELAREWQVPADRMRLRLRDLAIWRQFFLGR